MMQKGQIVTRTISFITATCILLAICEILCGQQAPISLHAAAESGNTQAINTLLDQGHDINQQDNRGYTPLLAAAAGGQVQAIELLVNHGADLNAMDNAGNTALHIATSYGHLEAVRVFLQKGLTTQARNYAGLTALDIARNAQRQELVAILEQASGIAPTESQTTQDPNQIWRQEALAVMSQTARLAAALAKYRDINEAVTALAIAGQQELRTWIQRTSTQATRLQSQLLRQITSELELIRKIAHEQGATRTAADTNQLIATWETRLKTIADRLREQRRQELAQIRGRPSTPRTTLPTLTGILPPQPQTVPPSPSPNTPASYFSAARLKADTDRLAQTWVAAGQDVRQLLTDVNDLITRDLGYLRNVALEEKASEKTLAALDAVIAIRIRRMALAGEPAQIAEPQQPGQGGRRRRNTQGG